MRIALCSLLLCLALPVLAGDADGWTSETAVADRLAREREIDPDIWIIAIADSAARNPFALI